jgi:hypothetical protein
MGSIAATEHGHVLPDELVRSATSPAPNIADDSVWETKDAEMRRLQDEVPDGMCNHGTWILAPSDEERDDWLSTVVPQVCGARPAFPTDAPGANAEGTTRVCVACHRGVILLEQISAAFDHRADSREWLLRNGHRIYAVEDLFPDDVTDDPQ